MRTVIILIGLITFCHAQYVGPIERNVHYQINKKDYTPLKDFNIRFSDTAVKEEKVGRMPFYINTYSVNNKSINVNQFSEYLIIESKGQEMWIKSAPYNHYGDIAIPFLPGVFKFPSGYFGYKFDWGEAVEFDNDIKNFKVKDTSKTPKGILIEEELLSSVRFRHNEGLIDVSFNSNEKLLGLVFQSSPIELNIEVQNTANNLREKWGAIRIDSLDGRIDISIKNQQEAYLCYHRRSPFENKVFYTNNKGAVWKEISFGINPVDFYFKEDKTYVLSYDSKNSQLGVYMYTKDPNSWKPINQSIAYYGFYYPSYKSPFRMVDNDVYIGYKIERNRQLGSESLLHIPLQESVFDWGVSNNEFQLTKGKRKILATQGSFIPFASGNKIVLACNDFLLYSGDGGESWERKFFNLGSSSYEYNWQENRDFRQKMNQLFSMTRELYTELDGNYLRAYGNLGIWEIDMSSLWE
jgi:hypothetical protein